MYKCSALPIVWVLQESDGLKAKMFLVKQEKKNQSRWKFCKSGINPNSERFKLDERGKTRSIELG